MARQAIDRSSTRIARPWCRDSKAKPLPGVASDRRRHRQSERSANHRIADAAEAEAEDWDRPEGCDADLDGTAAQLRLEGRRLAVADRRVRPSLPLSMTAD